MNTKIRLADFSPTEWVKENQIKTDGGKELYFTGNRKFLFKPFSDLSPLICVMKAAQVGFSTLAITKMFFVAEKIGLSFIYTFPTGDLMTKYVKGKVNPLLDANPKSLKALITDTDNVFQKRIGFSNIIFSGAEKENQAIAFSSDCNVHDELDSSNQQIIPQFYARMQASPYKWEWVFSHPSINEVGVHAYWEKSCQYHWFVTCETCKKEQFMRFPQSIDFERECFQCKFCRAEMSDKARESGRWVAKYKKSDNRPYAGYWMPLMICSWVTAKEIITASKKDPYYFYTRVLGLPYSTGNDRVTKEQVFKNITTELNDRTGRLVIGVDTGLPIWYVIGNKKGIFFWGKCKNPDEGYDPYEELDLLMQKFPKMIMVADQGGDLIGIRKLRAKYPGRVFLCHYRKNRKTLQLVTWGKKDEDGNVVVDRNRMVQLVVDELLERRLPIYGSRVAWDEYAEHWSHIYRVGEENEHGKIEYKWVRNDADHLTQATVYWRVGIARFGGEGSIFEPLEFTPPKQNSYELNPDGTVSVDMKKLMNTFADEKEDDWRN
jgi:hypothetical protein